MKKVSDLIEELQDFPPDLPVYHYDGKSNFTFPKLEIAETIIEDQPYRYLMISSSEEKEEDAETKESEITD